MKHHRLSKIQNLRESSFCRRTSSSPTSLLYFYLITSLSFAKSLRSHERVKLQWWRTVIASLLNHSSRKLADVELCWFLVTQAFLVSTTTSLHMFNLYLIYFCFCLVSNSKWWERREGSTQDSETRHSDGMHVFSSYRFLLSTFGWILHKLDQVPTMILIIASYALSQGVKKG